MESDPDHVITIVHHDAEDRHYLSGFDPPGTYVRDVKYYGVSREQLKDIDALSISCQQSLKIECFSVAGLVTDYWVDVDGEQRTFLDENQECIMDRATKLGETE